MVTIFGEMRLVMPQCWIASRGNRIPAIMSPIRHPEISTTQGIQTGMRFTAPARANGPASIQWSTLSWRRLKGSIIRAQGRVNHTGVTRGKCCLRTHAPCSPLGLSCPTLRTPPVAANCTRSDTTMRSQLFARLLPTTSWWQISGAIRSPVA